MKIRRAVITAAGPHQDRLPLQRLVDLDGLEKSALQIIIEEVADKKGKALRQQFVRLGLKRGDFVAVASGVKEGEAVVSTGVFKLRNGQPVVVDNTLAPDFKKAPKPENN